MNLLSSLSTLTPYYEMGGFVMPPLILVSIVLWYALAFRFLYLDTSNRNPRQLIKKAARKKGNQSRSILGRAAQFAVDTAQSYQSHRQVKALVNQHFTQIKIEMSRYRRLVRSLVAVAPLLGLLGTVDGMIETFDSLGDMALFSQSGGIAGGISKALFTTQMGLAVSIPGLLFGRIIERKEVLIGRQLDQMRDLVCVEK